MIYGLLTETSIGKLFIAGVIPGILGVGFYLLAVAWTIRRNPASGPRGERTTWPMRLKALFNVWAVILLFILVFGGLYGVLNFWPLNLTFSPTEAAGMGAAGAFLIAIFRGMRLRDTYDALRETARTTATLFSVLIGAWIFSNFVNLAGLPEALLAIVTANDLSPAFVILFIIMIYLILGCVFESLSMLLLTVPIFLSLIHI